MRRLWLVLLATASACGSSSQTPDAAVPPDDLSAGRQIRYVLALVKENHTFDNYFADYPGVEGALTAPIADGGTRNRQVLGTGALSLDPDHTRPAALIAYNGGLMNGFGDAPNNFGDPVVFGYYTKPQVALYHNLADNFVLCDHFFTSTLGPSFPGHLSLITAQSPAFAAPYCPSAAGCALTGPIGCDDTTGWVVPVYNPDTCATDEVPPCFDLPTVIDALPGGYTWRAYADQEGNSDRFWTPFRSVRSTGESAAMRAAHFRSDEQLIADLTAGDQANVTYAELGRDGISEHPPEDICPGEQYTAAILNAAMNGPHWNEMVIVVTWDDWGGFYDHVAPDVRRCPNGLFFGPGFRVPTLILSPYAKKGYVLRTPTEQASIPRLIEELLGMPFLAARDPHARDEKAGSLMEALDLTQTPRPPMTVSQTCP